jgi:hypothetical protein
MRTFIIVVIVILVGYVVWSVFNTSARTQNATTNVTGTNVTADLQTRVNLHALLTEHGNVAASHLSDLYDGKDTKETGKKLEENTQKLADMIEELGTAEDREAFVTTFRGHIKEYENYTMGLKDQDETKMTAAKEMLMQHAADFAALTNKLIPAVTAQRAEELMNEHGTLTLGIIDAHAQDDPTKKLTFMKDATVQANKFADELVKGIQTTPNP